MVPTAKLEPPLWFGLRAFAGGSGNEKDAPKPVVRRGGGRLRKSVLL
jgi:hypothetical protein